MSETTNCPTADRLRSLLDGRLPEAEQAELQQHIDSCERRQQTLEGLVAGKESWDGIARRLGDIDTPVTPALNDAIAEAKNAIETAYHHKSCPDADDVPIKTLLEPSEQPDSMGRLAHYEVLQEVGSGGMGIVLKAFDTSLRRVVAIKVMAPHLAANAAARRRFVREAQAAAAVAHEHVVAIHAVADQHEPPYLAMQFIEGKTLQERLDESGPLSVREVLRIGMQTAAGLAAAHAQGLVHRDIKPANILLENGVERVKLTDFGLARAVDDASVTQSGVIAGTPLFMSPEQARGEAVDHRSDLFSLGSVLYAMCSGHAPFRASTTMGVLKRVCEESPRPIREVNPDVPEWLATIVAKLLAKNPADRFQTAKEVGDVLGQSLAHVQQPTTLPMPPRVSTPAWTAGAGYSTPVPAHQTPMAVLPEHPSLKEKLARLALLPLGVCGIVLLTGAPALVQKGAEYQWAILGCAAVLLLLTLFLLAYMLQAANRRRVRAAGSMPEAQLLTDAVRSTHPTPAVHARRRVWLIAATGIGALLVGIAVLGTIVYLATEDGTLVIETEDPNVQIAVSNRGQRMWVVDTKGSSRLPVRLRPGQYELDLLSDHAVLELHAGRVTIRRGESVVVRITHKPSAPRDVAGTQVAGPPAASASGSSVESDTAPIANAVKDAIAWGSPSPNGMQLGHKLEPRKTVYRLDDRVKVRLFLRNSGKNVISTTLPRLEVLEKFGFDLSLLDDQDKKLPWTWGKAHKSRELFTVSGGMELPLRPGMIHELPAAEIVIGKEASSQTTMAILDAEPGQTCRLACKLGTYGYAKGEGEPLASGEIKFQLLQRNSEPTNGEQTNAVTKLLLDDAGVWNLTRSPDGKLFGAIGPNGDGSGSKVNVWDAATLAERLTFTTEPTIHDLVFLPDGQRIATGESGPRIRIRDLTSGTVLNEFGKFTDDTLALAVGDDGESLIFGGPDMLVRLWDLKTQTVRQSFAGATTLIHSVAASPDGKFVAAGCENGHILIWDAKTAERRHLWTHFDRKVTSIAFSPDSQHLAAASWNHLACVFDLGNDYPWKFLKAHTDHVRTIAWSPDGKQLVTASSDGTAIVWDASKADRIAVFNAKVDQCFDAVFLDNARVATAHRDGYVRAWKIPQSQPSAEASGSASPAILQELRELVAQHEEDLKLVRQQYEAGVGPAAEVMRCETALTEAKIRLANAESRTDDAIRLLDELVKQHEELVKSTEQLVQSGNVPASELARARKNLIEVRLQREIARQQPTSPGMIDD